jgi:glucose-6-phosphate 1-dehydrogenase
MNGEAINLVLFGSTGDLARLKILPALEKISQLDTPKIKLYAVGRRETDTLGYLQELAKDDIHPFTGDLSGVDVEYIKVDFTKENSFSKLISKLGTSPSIFYFALTPPVSHLAARRLAEGLKQEDKSKYKVVLEKPYGDSLLDTQQILTQLYELCTEGGVYLNDHYLHKPALRAIHKLRFEDSHIIDMFRPGRLKELNIIVSEQIAVGNRAGYFDGRGMSVDWLQSHVLQMLSMMTVGTNSTKQAEFLQGLKAHPASIVRAQYTGYTSLQDVPAGSTTETFLSLVFTNERPEWQGVSFKMVMGKGLADKTTCIDIVGRSAGESVQLCISPVGGHPTLTVLGEKLSSEYEDIILGVIAGKHQEFVAPVVAISQWQVTEVVRELMEHVPLGSYAEGTSWEAICSSAGC